MNKPKIRIITVLLVISLLFNLFFIIGYLKTKSILNKLKTPDGRIELVSKKIGFDNNQFLKIKDIMNKLNSEKAKIKQDNINDIDAYWTEVIKENPDTEKIDILLKKSAMIMDKTNRVSTEYLLKMFKNMNMDQRKKLVKIIKEKNI